MRLYKLTDHNARTRFGMQWGPGITNSLPPREYPQICTVDVIHAYTDPDLALLMNPVHRGHGYSSLLWKSEGDPCVIKPDKVGCFSLTTIDMLPMPDWYIDVYSRNAVQRSFAVLTANDLSSTIEFQFPDDNRLARVVESIQVNASKSRDLPLDTIFRDDDITDIQRTLIKV